MMDKKVTLNWMPEQSLVGWKEAADGNLVLEKLSTPDKPPKLGNQPIGDLSYLGRHLGIKDSGRPLLDGTNQLNKNDILDAAKEGSYFRKGVLLVVKSYGFLDQAGETLDQWIQAVIEVRFLLELLGYLQEADPNQKLLLSWLLSKTRTYNENGVTRALSRAHNLYLNLMQDFTVANSRNYLGEMLMQDFLNRLPGTIRWHQENLTTSVGLLGWIYYRLATAFLKPRDLDSRIAFCVTCKSPFLLQRQDHIYCSAVFSRCRMRRVRKRALNTNRFG